MKLTVNKKTISTVLNEPQLNGEIAEYLKDFIQEELSKDTPDCDLIDECIDVLEKMQRERDAAPALRLMVTKPQMMAYCRRRTKSNAIWRGVLAASLAVIMGGTAAFYTVPAFADGVRSLFDHVVYSLSMMASDTDEKSEVVSVYATVPEDADVSNIQVTAVLRDGREQAVPLSECRISQTEEESEGKRYVLTVIAYKGCACSLITETEEGEIKP